MTLAELLALLPDNVTGDIGADDMRTITTDLYNAAHATADADALAAHVDALAAHLAANIAVTDTAERFTADNVEQVLAEVRDRITTEVTEHDADDAAHGAAFDAFAMSMLQMSPQFLRGHALLYDDFYGTGVTTGQIAQTGWALASGLGGTVSAGIVDQGRPGWYQLGTGTTDPAGRVVIFQNALQWSGHNAFVFEASVNVNALNDGSNQSTFRLGLHDDTGAVANEPVDGFYFELTPADATLHCRCANASVRADVDSNRSMVANTWVRLGIESDGGGVVYFYVDGTLVTPSGISGASIPGTGRYGPVFSVTKVLGLAAHNYRIDYVYWLQGVTR